MYNESTEVQCMHAHLCIVLYMYMHTSRGGWTRVTWCTLWPVYYKASKWRSLYKPRKVPRENVDPLQPSTQVSISFKGPQWVDFKYPLALNPTPMSPLRHSVLDGMYIGWSQPQLFVNLSDSQTALLNVFKALVGTPTFLTPCCSQIELYSEGTQVRFTIHLHVSRIEGQQWVKYL